MGTELVYSSWRRSLKPVYNQLLGIVSFPVRDWECLCEAPPQDLRQSRN
ncbi:hypothetical protein [Nostoc sp.]